MFFTLHHMFLTPQGVYLVVFNAQELVLGETIRVDGKSESVDASVQARCLKYIRLWCNSILLFAPRAPVFLVGTHKDKLNDQKLLTAYNTLEQKVIAKCPKSLQLQKASNKQFCHFVSNVTKSPRGFLKSVSSFFFPSTTNRPTHDPSIETLRKLIESVAVSQEHVHEKVPIEWLAVKDALANDKESKKLQRLTLQAMFKIAKDCGLGNVNDIPFEAEVSAMLKKFHELGLVVWYNTVQLRDMVVLNPQWLINAASTIIRDPQKHPLASDVTIMRMMGQEWEMLFERAVLDVKLIPWLYPKESYTDKERTQLAILMEKFGLIVRLYCDKSRISWLVPSMLKSQKIVPLEAKDGSMLAECYLHFSMSPNTEAVLSQSDLENGFLPAGLFPRIIGNAVMWAQQTNGLDPDAYILTNKHAHLYFGVDEFTMDLEESLNCIKLTISKVPTGVFNRVLSIVRKSISELSLGGDLTVSGLIKYNDHYIDMVRLGLQLESPQNVPSTHTNPKFQVEGQLKTLEEMRESCKQWTFPTEAESHDVYVACFDHADGRLKNFNAKLQDCQHGATLKATGAAPRVFDRSQLRPQPGKSTAMQIAESIQKSKLFVPVISTETIRHFKTLSEDPDCIDCLLLEWWTALQLCPDHIVPIFLPKFSSDGTDQPVSFGPGDELFQEIADKSISEPTLDELTKCLESLGSGTPKSITIRRIVERIAGNVAIDPVKKKGNNTNGHATDNPLWNLEMLCSQELVTIVDDMYYKPKSTPSDPSPVSVHSPSLELGPDNAPWRWPAECEQEWVSHKEDDMFVKLNERLHNGTSATVTHIRKMISESGGKNSTFDFEQVQECIVFHNLTELSAFNTSVEKQKNHYKRREGHDVTHSSHIFCLDWDRTSPHMNATMNYLRTCYPSRLPSNMVPGPDDTPYQSLLVYHGLFGDVEHAKHVCKSGFRVIGIRNDGWFGNGVYYTPDLVYALAYANDAKDICGTKRAIVIGLEIVLFNPSPVINKDFEGRPIKNNADAHVAVVRHSNDLSVPTVPIPPTEWDAPNSSGSTPVSTEIVVQNNHAVLPRFMLLF
eukprot:m.330721 g.330721  ORF g.330721 m.330721 type:complete len:1065 (+) comp16588_c0_seq13:909-4103(+)